HSSDYCPYLHSFPTRRSSDLVITKATMRIDPIPESRSFLSFLFPDIYAGLEAGRLIMTNRLRPATIRLYDEEDSKKLAEWVGTPDRKSTRLNSSHVKISYAVF